MMQKLDLNTWNRREHFEFFSAMDEPFYGLTVKIECTKAYEKAKELEIPFFTYYLHKTLVAINAIENFRYRIIDKEPYVFDRIDVSSTVMRADKTFGFSLIEFDPDLHKFHQNLEAEVARIQETSGLITREFNDPNLIHFSALPWVDFTSMSHARGYSYPDSCPKISFGKLTEGNGVKSMPMSLHVHHGLVDGYHVGLFLEEFQNQMNA
ncbi:chloramphenicol acetyltransferase [Flavobacterium amnicola]|uniref:Chloramphenicol acetyltransferase n=1 Tax=Flavobacterium amnicola TaxID=2506422 RepID=A0A4Q1K590_9FLAO|nr:chloramphenicol acetyltransferase [Flavobacterium amnicola]RXR21063.1 chloramphenicol acetyltransferase [Flavobacterium amnicola]